MDLHRRRSVLVGLVFGVVASLSDWLAASRGVTFTWKQYKTTGGITLPIPTGTPRHAPNDGYRSDRASAQVRPVSVRVLKTVGPAFQVRILDLPHQPNWPS
jgi:hypothetical protein